MVNIALAVSEEMVLAKLEGIIGMMDAVAEVTEVLHHLFCVGRYFCGTLFMAIGLVQILWKYLLYRIAVLSQRKQINTRIDYELETCFLHVSPLSLHSPHPSVGDVSMLLSV